MFYNSGEVISDQFNHITLDSKSGKFWKKSAKTRSFGNFFLREGGASPIPKSLCQNSCQKVNILMKTKNAPNDLKCKINHIFFLATGIPKRGGGGGGVRHLGKIPKKSRFFLGSVPKLFATFWLFLATLLQDRLTKLCKNGTKFKISLAHYWSDF